MTNSKTLSFVIAIVIATWMSTAHAQAQSPNNNVIANRAMTVRAGEPSWYPYTFARPGDREQIRSTPIENRPYRPLHFYGNTMRRNYYRGAAVPMPRDIYQTIVMPARRR